MSKFFVVCGYLSPDHYTSDDGPVLEIHVFPTEEAVLSFHRQFLTDIDTSEDKECLIFRVFEGAEREVVPVKRVTEYKLQ